MWCNALLLLLLLLRCIGGRTHMLIAHYSRHGITTKRRGTENACASSLNISHGGQLSGAFEAARQDMRATPWLSGASYFIRHLLSSHGFPRLMPQPSVVSRGAWQPDHNKTSKARLCCSKLKRAWGLFKCDLTWHVSKMLYFFTANLTVEKDLYLASNPYSSQLVTSHHPPSTPQRRVVKVRGFPNDILRSALPLILPSLLPRSHTK